MHTIEVEQIRKTYDKGSVLALDEISFAVKKGEIFGLIGPDGAGKTSLFRILTTLLLADSGAARVAGHDVVKDYREIRKLVGYMPGRFSLYQDLTIAENIQFFATVFGTSLEENYHLIEDIYVQIEPFKDRPAGKLSGGMKQKLALCCALIHEPEVLFLDEPTTGVDPVSRKEFWEMLGRLRQRDITILVSTPYMDEASKCDRIALMQKGKILDLDALDQILAKHRETIYAVQAAEKHRLLLDLRTFQDAQNAYAFGTAHHLVMKNGHGREDQLRQFLEQKGHHEIMIERVAPQIEDVFIQLMNVATND